jgi:hypothetical protein
MTSVMALEQGNTYDNPFSMDQSLVSDLYEFAKGGKKTIRKTKKTIRKTKKTIKKAIKKSKKAIKKSKKKSFTCP